MQNSSILFLSLLVIPDTNFSKASCVTISRWQNPTQQDLPDLPIRMLEILDNHRDKRYHLFIPNLIKSTLFLASSNRVETICREGGGEVTSCVLEERGQAQAKKRRQRRVQGTGRSPGRYQHGPFTPSGTGTKIISSFAAYENSPVKHLPPPCRSFSRSSFSILLSQLLVIFVLVLLRLILNLVGKIPCWISIIKRTIVADYREWISNWKCRTKFVKSGWQFS